MTLDAGCALQGLGTALKNTGGKGRPAETGGRHSHRNFLACSSGLDLFLNFNFRYLFLETEIRESSLSLLRGSAVHEGSPLGQCLLH